MDRQAPKTRLICPLTATSIKAMRAEMRAAARAGADTVECRLDFLSPAPSAADVARLLRGAPVDAIATCRPATQGGRFEGAEADRLALLRAAAEAGAKFVDVELGVLCDDWPDAAVILSRHDFETCPDDLDDLADRLDISQAAVNKLAFAATGPQDALRAFDIIRAVEKPTIALAMGEAGLVSRILAKKFRAFGTFAALRAGGESAPGQPTINQLKRLYRWDAVNAGTAVFGLIGCPVGHSMSPAVHNAALAAAGVNGVYVPLLVQPGAESFNAFMEALLDRPWMNWRGLSVTIPHKQNALAYLGRDTCDELAARIGAVNTMTVKPDGSVQGHNTDYASAIDALCDAMGIARKRLAGRTVAVLGAGGAARAIVAALASRGAETTIYNRTVSRGESLAREFGARSAPREALDGLDAEIVINCTPIGMHPKTRATPLKKIPPCVKVVFDTIYNPIETRLLRQARDAGAMTVSGLEMFVNQAAAQFRLWTKRAAPRQVMHDVAVQSLRRRPR